MEEFKDNIVPGGNNLIVVEEQRELFDPEFTVEANLVKYSAVFPPHSPDTPLYSTKHIDAIPASQGGGVIVTELTTSTSPYKVRGVTTTDRVPGDFEKKVFYAIVSIWVTTGKPADGIVQFSIGKLIEQLGLTTGGKNYQMVKEAISRINRSTIKIQGSYVSAPDFKKESRDFGLFDDCIESTTRRGRKSLNGNIETDFYRIKLNTTIVSNMIHDYSIVIQVKDYTSATSKYYRRLVDIIEFEFQKGRAVGKDKLEFLLSQLAKNLPLEGEANNVSTILKRLMTSMRELQELGGYQYEVTKVDNDAILTIFSKSYVNKINYKKSFQESIDEFFEINSQLFSKSLSNVIYETQKAILDYLNSDEFEIEYEGKKYYKSIHVLDVFIFQSYVKGYKNRMKNWSNENAERGSVIRLARSVMNGSIVLKYPDGFKPYYERLKELQAAVSKNQLESSEHNRAQNASNEALKQAKTLYAELSPVGLQAYFKRLKEEFPTVPEALLKGEKFLTDTIMEDILDGSLNKTHFKNLQPLPDNLISH